MTRWTTVCLLRLRSLLRRGRVEDEMDAELRFHLAQQIAEHIAAGMSAGEAHEAAMRSAAGFARVREDCRESLGLRLIDEWRQDARFAARSLFKNPGFTIVATATLALAITANTTVFSAIDAVLLRPLPFPHADRLMRLRQVQER